MPNAPTELNVQVIIDQPRQSTRHLELHFDQPLLTQGEHFVATPSSYTAGDNDNNCTPLLEGILAQLYGDGDIGVTQVFATPHHLIIDHFAALKLDEIMRRLREATFSAGMVFRSSSGS